MLRDDILRCARSQVLFLPHAIRQMSRPLRMITEQEVRRVVMRGEVIEDYPENARGHSCLMLGSGILRRPIHVVCSPMLRFLAIITVYLPGVESIAEHLDGGTELTPNQSLPRFHSQSLYSVIACLRVGLFQE